MKLKSRGAAIKPALIRFGVEVEAILKRRPAVGPLFPYLRTVRANDRATEFRQRCDGLGIAGVSLHSYRYAWAERALKCGYRNACGSLCSSPSFAACAAGIKFRFASASGLCVRSTGKSVDEFTFTF